MNYFAHGREFIDDGYFLAGTAVPDWLGVVDRKARVRSRQAQELSDVADPQAAAVGRGIVRHHRDDAWFHETRAFAELSWQLTVAVRDALPPDDGLRPSFLGHILVELLLDAVLIEADPGRLERYYEVMAAIDPLIVQAAVNQVAPRPAERLHAFISIFCRERFLWDYLDDGKLLFRLNQVMRRVTLAPLPPAFEELLPWARRLVAARSDELLAARPDCDSRYGADSRFWESGQGSGGRAQFWASPNAT